MEGKKNKCNMTFVSFFFFFFWASAVMTMPSHPQACNSLPNLPAHNRSVETDRWLTLAFPLRPRLSDSSHLTSLQHQTLALLPLPLLSFLSVLYLHFPSKLHCFFCELKSN